MPIKKEVKSSVFYEEPQIKELKNNLIETNTTEEQLIEQAMDMPEGYIEVKLDSIGKLAAPMTLHFKNFSMDDMTELSLVREELHLQKFLSILNKNCHENFDCSKLHPEDLTEVCLTLYLSFTGKNLSGYSYYIDDTIEDDDKKNEDKNIGEATIDITTIDTTPLPESFKEPFEITYKGNKVGFRLTRVGDAVIARTYLKNKYAIQDKKYSDIKAKVESNDEITRTTLGKGTLLAIDETLYNDYLDYINQKLIDYSKVIASLLLVSYNDKVLETLEEKLEVYGNIHTDFYKIYDKVVKEKLDFGVKKDITFFCIHNKKPITRRFQFRYLDFLPSNELSGDSEYQVSF